MRPQGVAPSFWYVSNNGVFQLKPVKPPPPVPDAAPLIESKKMPYPVRITKSCGARYAMPMRGPKFMGSTLYGVLSEFDANTRPPFRGGKPGTCRGEATFGSIQLIRLYRSVRGRVSSYRKPAFTVSRLVGRQLSWKYQA